MSNDRRNDAANATAIAETALRPNLHYVAVKSAEHRARTVASRTHQSFVGQRTRLINALPGRHLGEFGPIVAQGPTGFKTVEIMVDDDATELPDAVREIVRLYLDQIAMLTKKIDDAMPRLCTVPGVGPVTAGAPMVNLTQSASFHSWLNDARQIPTME